MTGIGSADLARYLAGKQLTPSRTLRAKCCDCQGNYTDGKEDCNNRNCPVHPWMPYSKTPRPKSEAKAKVTKERHAKAKLKTKKVKK